MKKFVLFVCLALVFAACSNHGKKVSKDYLEVYYKDGVEKETAEKLLNFLYPAWKSESGETEKKSVQLTKSGDTINFRAVVNIERINQIGDETFYSMANELSEKIFNSAPVNIVFTDEKFKTLRTLAFRKTDPADKFGEKVTSGKVTVYAKGEVSLESAQKIADFINSKGVDAEQTYQFTKDAEGYYSLSMVSSPSVANQVTDADLKTTAQEISSGALDNAPLVFNLADENFNSLKTADYNIDRQPVDTTAVQ